ncbi:MAG TPA: hypothetical protein DDW52_00165 [Planctomycetaceae bacterium]|nr:hypothetical protein [Planctomycetaceae bacterium]
MRQGLLTAFVFAIGSQCFFSAATTHAQVVGFGYGYGVGVPGSPLVLPAFTPPPPYFALHPPVYYGKRYTRPYGVSPFASPSLLQPNPSYVPKSAARRTLYPAVVIQNPYVVPTATRDKQEFTQVEPKSRVENSMPSTPAVTIQTTDNPFRPVPVKLYPVSEQN